MPTIPVSELDHIQHHAPDGGPVTSEWLNREHITPGHLVAVHTGWAAVEHVLPQRTAYVVQCRETDGGRALRYLAEHTSMETRTDVRVDLGHQAPLALAAAPTALRQRPVTCQQTVTAAELQTGQVVHRYVDDRAPAGRVWVAVPCCDRRAEIADVAGLNQILACCRCRLLYACQLHPDGDGGSFAVLTVLIDGLLPAVHRGGRQAPPPANQPLLGLLTMEGRDTWTSSSSSPQ